MAHLCRDRKHSTKLQCLLSMDYMMKLEYAGGEVLISEDLCPALMIFAAELARTGGSQNIQIPVLTPEGVRGFAEAMWPTSWAITDLSPADEKLIARLVRQAIGD
jgi:hypothetical protein